MKVAEDFLNEYQTQFGTRKFNKIKDSIQKDKRFNRFIEDCKQRGVFPYPKDYYIVVMNSPLLSFANKHKLTAMALLLMYRWMLDVNSSHGFIEPKELDGYSQKIINEGNSLGV